MASCAYELWKAKESPLWLLRASQSFAQYPTPGNISPEEVTLYLQQLTEDHTKKVRSRDFVAGLHPGHRHLFAHFANDALDYHWVFKEAYGLELVKQAQDACGTDSLNYLTTGHLEPHVVRNLIAFISMTAIRDMAIIEDSHHRGEIDAKERAFALKEINVRMDRLGLNGVDRLFESRPELEDYVRKDSTIISVGHFPTRAPYAKQTRAACYNLGESSVRGFSFEVRGLTGLREDIISGEFGDRARKFDHALHIHTHDLVEPSVEARRRYCVRSIPDINRMAYQKDHAEYLNFLIQDGIALYYPDRQKFIADLRVRAASTIDVLEAKEAPSEEPKLSSDAAVGKSTAQPEQPLSEGRALSVTPPDETRENRSQTPDGVDLPLAGRRKSSNHDMDIEDARIRRELPEERTSERPSLHKDSNTAAKVAAVGGTAAAAALGIWLSKGGGPQHSDGKKTWEREQESRALGKKIAFAAAITIAAGGAIAWTGKPKFLAVPIQKLLHSIVGKSAQNL